MLALRIGATNVTVWKAHLLRESFQPLWSWDFYLITLINMFAPVLGCAGLILSVVTGDAYDSGTSDVDGPHLTFMDRVNAGHWLVQAIELLPGAGLSFYCLLNLNVALFGFALSLLMGSVLVRSGWSKGIKLAVSFPFALIVGGMGLLGANLLAAQGVLLPLLIFHF